MSKQNLGAINQAMRIYGKSFNAFTLARSYFGTTKGLGKKELITLLHKANYHAYLANPKTDHSYPTLYWDDENIIAISVDGQDEVVLIEDKKKVLAKSTFLKNHKPKFAICIPPKEKTAKQKNGLFWGAFKGIKGLHVELLIIGLFINVFALGLPLYTLSVYDRVLPTFATSTLWALTIGIAIVLVLDFLFRVQKAKLLSYAQAYTATKQDENLLDKFLKQRQMPLSSGEQIEFFHLMQGAREAILTSILPAIADAPFILLFLAIIYALAPALMFVPITLIVVVLLIQIVLIPKINDLSQRSVEQVKKKESLLYEILFSNMSIRLTNATGRIRSMWRIHSKNVQHISERNRMWQQIGSISVTSLAQVSAVAVLVVGTFEVNTGALSIGSLIACSILSARAIAPALSVADALVKLQKVKMVIAETKKLEEYADESWTHNDLTPEHLTNVKGEMTCRDVLSVYPNNPKPVLENVNLTFKAGERVAILGRNGAGKSTLAKSLAGVLNPQSGQVLLDGVDIQRMPVSELREHVLLLAQSQRLMSGSVRDVVANSVVVDDDRLKEAIEMSGLDMMLSQTGIGLDADVGENGSNLSGGQRQMLSFAQALYRRSKVLIMDEPTSHFDHELEVKVRDHLKVWLDKYESTFVLVTHRLGLLTLVDRLIVMDNGQVVMDGPRDEVLKKLNGKV